MDWLISVLRGLRFRGKVRLMSPLVPRTGSRTARIFGAQVELDLSDYIQRMMYLGCFEREETSLLLRHLRPGMTFVDIGANAGYFTYLAASRVGSAGRVLAIEPDPILFAKLIKAVHTNHLDRVSALNIALGREAGKLPIFIPPPTNANRAPTMTPVPGWEQIQVRVRTFDDVLDEAQIGRVDLLKIDVEGYEAEALAGAARALGEGRIRAVLCEFNPFWLGEQGTTSERLWQTFVDYGFHSVTPRPKFAHGTVVNGFFTKG